MALAFPNHAGPVATRARARGIELEESFRDFLFELTGWSYPRVERLIEESVPVVVGRAVLTEREAQVVGLRALGWSNAEAAATLELGLETVKTHAKNAIRVLGARNMEHAVFLAATTGAIEGSREERRS
jgi:ATP/maltotriose-dependent transcriptional regulator MalT